MPLAIISATVRRSSPAAGADLPAPGRMDVLGWSAGPTVIQRIVPADIGADLEAEDVAVRPARRPGHAEDARVNGDVHAR